MYYQIRSQLLDMLTGSRIHTQVLSCVFYAFLAFCILLPLNVRAEANTPDVSMSQSAGVLANVRIKDIARISHVYDLQIYGYGLVVGLNGTGDSSAAKFTSQSMINMMQRQFGIDVSGGKLSTKNVAAVIVTAELPFFAKPYDRMDILVSSLGDAKSISGGTLLPTPLAGVDGQLYVLAQGSVLVGGFSASSGGGDKAQKNHPTVGNVPGGGEIIKIPPGAGQMHDYREGFTICLSEPDFTTATRVVSAINNEFPDAAQATDSSAVKITMPESEKDVVSFISRLENLTVVPDYVAAVVIDERTGTIVIGKDVRIAPVAVFRGSLSIEITAEEKVSQPPPMSAGETTTTTVRDLTVHEEKRSGQVIRGGVSIDELVKALNLIGATPRDMIVILQDIKTAGALHARLVVK